MLEKPNENISHFVTFLVEKLINYEEDLSCI